MIVFAEHITPRLNYSLHFVLTEQLGIEYMIISEFETFRIANTPKINYSELPATSGFQIIPEGLLAEDTLRNSKPELSYKSDISVIFSQEKGDLNFDIFSAVFWFLSRYEEYQKFTPDSHNRFPATESFAFKNQLLNRPIVDEWVHEFGKKLEKEFPGIELKNNKFNAATTIDVDSPWCYKNKGFVRNSGGLFRDILKGNFTDVKFRLKVLLSLTPDPWYNFEWIIQLAKTNGTKLEFFIHVGDYGLYDKSVNYNAKPFVNFVKYLGNRVDIGLHPSYNAAYYIEIFKKEISRLSKIAGRSITKSRQHFLVFSMAHYYPRLIEMGITDDYSMGFADKAGFRAGTSNSFYFFNLNINEETKLLIHPFAVMDRTLNSYESKSVEEAIETVKTLIENVKRVEGTFVSLWHNESLSDIHEWKGWRTGFQLITEYLASKK